jgi:hypothetical protein
MFNLKSPWPSKFLKYHQATFSTSLNPQIPDQRPENLDDTFPVFEDITNIAPAGHSFLS